MPVLCSEALEGDRSGWKLSSRSHVSSASCSHGQGQCLTLSKPSPGNHKNSVFRGWLSSVVAVLCNHNSPPSPGQMCSSFRDFSPINSVLPLFVSDSVASEVFLQSTLPAVAGSLLPSAPATFLLGLLWVPVCRPCVYSVSVSVSNRLREQRNVTGLFMFCITSANHDTWPLRIRWVLVDWASEFLITC